MSNHVKEKFIPWMEKKAAQLKSDAGHSGAHDDGGCQRILDIVQAYECGKNGFHPTMITAFVGYIKEYDKHTDEEWKEYLRLKEKFGE